MKNTTIVILLVLLAVSLAVAQTYQVLQYDNTGLADNDIVTWDSAGSDWIVEDPATAIGAQLSLGDLSDVESTNWTSGDVLYWTGSTWDDGDLGTLAGTYIAAIDLSDVTGLTIYTPTLGVSGGTWTSTTIAQAYYLKFNRFVTGYVEASGTCGSTPNNLRFTLPSGKESGTYHSYACVADDTATTTPNVRAISISSSTVAVYIDQDGSTTFANGTCVIYCTFNYIANS